MNTYNPEDLHKKPKKEKKEKQKTKTANGSKNYGLIIFLAVMVVLLGICIGSNIDLKNVSQGSSVAGSPYIGILEVHGTMSSDGTDPAYDQKWLLQQIDDMIYDQDNKGLMLSIDTPGGSVYTVDELYLKIKEYQEKTKRPVYAYMESMAASGGYYIAAPADMIYANRNCWTGSIGVTIGTIYDISEFLEGMGIKTVTITAGENKAMGSATEKLTKEQRAIYQSLVDEAYDQFVGVVAEGRNMSRKKTEVLADGRIYTAKQAKKNGLIDGIATREDAIDKMKTEHGLELCRTEVFAYEPEFSLSSWMFGMADKIGKNAKGEYDEIMDLVENHQTFSISYIANERN